MNDKIAMELDKWLFDIETGRAQQRRRGSYASISGVWGKFANITRLRYRPRGVKKPPTVCKERAYKGIKFLGVNQ